MNLDHLKFNPLQLSFLIHFSFLAFFFFQFLIFDKKSSPIWVPLESGVPQNIQKIEKIEERSKIVLKSINDQSKIRSPGRQIFGVSKQSYTDENNKSEADAKLGNTLAKTIDDEVRDFIEKAYSRAKELLSHNRDKLDTITQRLIEKEVIDIEEAKVLLGINSEASKLVPG